MASDIARPERVTRYNTTAIVLHWLVAALILINICAGLAGANADDKAAGQKLIDTHKSLGLTLSASSCCAGYGACRTSRRRSPRPIRLTKRRPRMASTG